MNRRREPALSRRERQIMDIVYRHGEAAAAEVLAELPEAPSYSAVRSLLRILEEKGHLAHREEGGRYLYAPTVPRDEARQTALQRVLATFFDGSVEGAVAALLELDEGPDPAELERLSALIDNARRQEEE